MIDEIKNLQDKLADYEAKLEAINARRDALKAQRDQSIVAARLDGDPNADVELEAVRRDLARLEDDAAEIAVLIPRVQERIKRLEGERREAEREAAISSLNDMCGELIELAQPVETAFLEADRRAREYVALLEKIRAAGAAWGIGEKFADAALVDWTSIQSLLDATLSWLARGVRPQEGAVRESFAARVKKAVHSVLTQHGLEGGGKR